MASKDNAVAVSFRDKRAYAVFRGTKRVNVEFRDNRAYAPFRDKRAVVAAK